MAKMKLSELKNLTEGEIVEVKGTLMYPRYLTRRLEGVDLDERIKKDKSPYPNLNPRFEFMLYYPTTVKKGDRPTEAELYVRSNIFEAKDGSKKLRCEKTAKSEKNYILTGVRQENGTIKARNLKDVSLDNGQPVTVQYKTRKYFDTAHKEKFTIELFSVIFEEEPKLWNPEATALPEGWLPANSEPETNTQTAGNVWED